MAAFIASSWPLSCTSPACSLNKLRGSPSSKLLASETPGDDVEVELRIIDLLYVWEARSMNTTKASPWSPLTGELYAVVGASRGRADPDDGCMHRAVDGEDGGNGTDLLTCGGWRTGRSTWLCRLTEKGTGSRRDAGRRGRREPGRRSTPALRRQGCGLDNGGGSPAEALGGSRWRWTEALWGAILTGFTSPPAGDAWLLGMDGLLGEVGGSPAQAADEKGGIAGG